MDHAQWDIYEDVEGNSFALTSFALCKKSALALALVLFFLLYTTNVYIAKYQTSKVNFQPRPQRKIFGCNSQ